MSDTRDPTRLDGSGMYLKMPDISSPRSQSSFRLGSSSLKQDTSTFSQRICNLLV